MVLPSHNVLAAGDFICSCCS